MGQKKRDDRMMFLFDLEKKLESFIKYAKDNSVKVVSCGGLETYKKGEFSFTFINEKDSTKYGYWNVTQKEFLETSDETLRNHIDILK